MTDFTEKFEQLLRDIVEIKVTASKSETETKVLSARLNGTIEKMNKHLDETDTRAAALQKLWITIILQIVSFAFFLGGIIWMVYSDNKKIESLSGCQEKFIEHIIRAEARWDKGGM